MRPNRKGFTLIELAVAIFIIGILLGSIFVPLQTQLEQRQIRDTELALALARDAIIGYAVANGYLPCPDSTASNDGLEDIVGGPAFTCATDAGGVSTGNLPAATLNLPSGGDAWGNRIRYRVVSAYAARPGGITMTMPASLVVCSAVACGAGTVLTNSTAGDQAAFVLISHGRNGNGGNPLTPSVVNAAATDPDEIANAGAGAISVSRVPSPTFDDIVAWLGRSVLLRHLVASGKLP